jgi:hypothetical protein
MFVPTFREFTDMHHTYADTRDDKKKETKRKFDRMRTKWNQSERLVRCSIDSRDLSERSLIHAGSGS